MPNEMSIETVILVVLSIFCAYLATQGLKTIAKGLSNRQLGLLGLACVVGFLATIGFIFFTELPGSTAVTPAKILVLTWVAVGDECFKLANSEEA